jgi:hypothetical protein
MRSEEMGAAGANLNEIAPDLLTLVALEESWSDAAEAPNS